MARLVTVCSGNICRSVFAQAYLAQALPEWEVDSAGTGAYHRWKVPYEVRDLASAVGQDVSGHKATPISETLLGNADLVLTAAVEHRDAVLGIWPRGLRRAFTIIEASEIIALLSDDTDWSTMEPKERVAALAANRRRIPGGEQLDVADPFGGPPEGYQQMGRDMTPHLDRIAKALSA